MDKQYFIVTSHGWSASNWVAHALNKHPDIVCSHSARNVLANDTELQSNQNLKIHLAQLHKGYVSRQERGLDVSYDEIEAMDAGKFYGSVHTYRLRDLPVVYERFGQPHRSFSLINLVRNPVDLVWSGYGQFKDLFRYDINELHWTLGKVLSESREFVFALGNKYNLNLGEFENLAFIGAACVLGSLRKDLDAVEKVKTLPGLDFRGYVHMEKITRDPEEFGMFLKRLLPDAAVSAEYLQSVASTGQINKHKHDSKSLTPAERYASFSEWQKEAFNFYFNHFRLQADYEETGYDFSFLK